MRESQAARVRATFRRLMDMLSGTPVTCVDPDDTEFDLTALEWDARAAAALGVQIDSGGVSEERVRKLAFHTDYLSEQGVSFDPTWHWIIDGDKWDFAKNEPINDRIVPIGGLHCLVVVTLREAAELKRALDESAELTIGD